LNLEIRIIDMPETKDIELRSEKVRNIVGKIPPATDRYGITIIGLVIAIVVAVSMLIPYQEEIHFTVTANPLDPSMCVTYIEPQKAQQLQQGMTVTINVNGLTIEGDVISISEKRINGLNVVDISLRENEEITIKSVLQASVTLTEKSWFDAIVGK